jgi:PIN domain nuclease of toxin-antitoxin system
MSNSFLVTDTHPLIWYLAKHDKKLPKRVFAAFKSAQDGTGVHIRVPAAVAWEISLLMRKTNRITTPASFEELIAEDFFFKSMTVTDLTAEDLVIAHSLTFNRDPFDSLIVATARRLELPLITADEQITESNACGIFWT